MPTTSSSLPSQTSLGTPPPRVTPEVTMMPVESPHPGPSSFKDKLLCGSHPIPAATDNDFVEQEGDIVSFLTPEGPVVKISDRYRAMLHKRWENTLILKMWGRNINYRTLCSRLPNLWKLKESVRVVDLANNFYFFNPASHKVTSVVAWIQIPDISCEYYDRGILRAVCNEIGKLIRLDHNTEEAIRGHYARVAVELDLTKPLQSQVFVDDKWYFISYENIPQICFHCGIAGHLMSSCPYREPVSLHSKEAQAADDQTSGGLREPNPGGPKIQQSPAQPPCGEWMIAGKRYRPPRTGGGQPRKAVVNANQAVNRAITSQTPDIVASSLDPSPIKPVHTPLKNKGQPPIPATIKPAKKADVSIQATTPVTTKETTTTTTMLPTGPPTFPTWSTLPITKIVPSKALMVNNRNPMHSHASTNLGKIAHVSFKASKNKPYSRQEVAGKKISKEPSMPTHEELPPTTDSAMHFHLPIPPASEISAQPLEISFDKTNLGHSEVMDDPMSEDATLKDIASLDTPVRASASPTILSSSQALLAANNEAPAPVV
ncbi:hypothetical protein Tsubulata_031413 [Turnera subulata]|uniref:CCHC-type domain-containing protein n=1 Tax=Turnera subulata TaxID=218843 RepID=A0A9Q0J9B7_9ROSI|nr:hypothetical protein Tsubulata_031413 [Turnera subulata]